MFVTGGLQISPLSHSLLCLASISMIPHSLLHPCSVDPCPYLPVITSLHTAISAKPHTHSHCMHPHSLTCHNTLTCLLINTGFELLLSSILVRASSLTHSWRATELGLSQLKIQECDWGPKPIITWYLTHQCSNHAVF